MKKKLSIIAFLLVTLLSCSDEPIIDDSVKVSGLTLSNKSLTMLVGDEFKLTYKIEPLDATDMTVVWESMNTDVVTVDQTGVVKAVSSGQANVMIKSTNDVYDICSVVVEEETVFNKMVGHWAGYKIQWLDNVTGEILEESSVKDVLYPGQSDEWYQDAIELTRTLYCFDLYKDSSMQLGILCQDMDYRYVPGTLTESEAINTYHASFKLKGTRYEHLTHLYELDFKYFEEEEHLRLYIHEAGERYDVITYYKVYKNQEEK